MPRMSALSQLKQILILSRTDQGENCPATRLLYKTQVAPGNFYIVRAYNEPVKGFGITYYPSNGWASVSAYNSVPLLPDSGSVGVEDYKTSLFLWNPPTGTIVGKTSQSTCRVPELVKSTSALSSREDHLLFSTMTSASIPPIDSILSRAKRLQTAPSTSGWFGEVPARASTLPH
jgi:hypothetical protein